MNAFATRFSRRGREVVNNLAEDSDRLGSRLDSEQTTDLYPRSPCPSTPPSPLGFVRSKHVSLNPNDVYYTSPNLTTHYEPQVKHDRLPTKLLQGVVFLPTTPRAPPASPSSSPPPSGTVFSESNKPDIIL